MKALLVRVGIDSRCGEWNAPVNPHTNEFAYVPIPETEEIYSGYEKPYELFKIPCQRLDVRIPENLLNYKSAHLDPDFSHLTYGDVGTRGKRVSKLEKDDIVVFYAGLRSTIPKRYLVYALIGLYVVCEKVSAKRVPESDWDKNAHTRKQPGETDVIVRAKSGESGRLERCIPIGEYRSNAYRVTGELLSEWGGLSVKDGYIQQSGTLPWFCDSEKFYGWFRSKKIKLMPTNN